MWWPAAARYRLSGDMQRRFTCESGCGIVREQIPESASQKLELVSHDVCEPEVVAHTESCGRNRL